MRLTIIYSPEYRTKVPASDMRSPIHRSHIVNQSVAYESRHHSVDCEASAPASPEALH